MAQEDKHLTATQQAIDFITLNIISGRFTAGNRLPPLRQMAKMIGVSGYPVQEAIARLKERKIVDSIVGSGVYVSKDAAAILTVNMPKMPKYRNIAVISAFIFHNAGVFIEHNVTAKGLFAECKEQLIRPTLISPFINLEDKEEVVNEVIAGKFEGVLWLYPTEKHLKSVKAIVKAGIPTVITSHEPLGVNIPMIEENIYDIAKQVQDIFRGNNCKKIIFFDLANSMILPKVFQTYDNTIEVEVLKIPYGGDHFRMEIKKKLACSDENLGVFLINNRDFRSFLSDSPDELLEILKKHTVVFDSEENVYNEIKPLFEKIDMSVIIHSFSLIGKLAIQKLSVVMDGKLEKTTTLVPLELIKNT